MGLPVQCWLAWKQVDIFVHVSIKLDTFMCVCANNRMGTRKTIYSRCVGRPLPPEDQTQSHCPAYCLCTSMPQLIFISRRRISTPQSYESLCGISSKWITRRRAGAARGSEQVRSCDNGYWLVRGHTVSYFVFITDESHHPSEAASRAHWRENVWEREMLNTG